MAGLKLSQLAGLWSKDKTFILYLNNLLAESGEQSAVHYGLSEEDLSPADFIRETCGIVSRRELDTNDEAARVFSREIREPFMQWAKKAQREAA
ncbi:hypothetical protein [Chromobacterium haemolyticum]|uniref:hypothetical protein n=1 Tax=Chromobacterium haemolyticum TaxID=394935 RepID=UPI002446ABB0|nr:hypothetical protein [Chromobacterium haemolyticum]MDH0342093.1 hypothetical protein [Chromobacterium haemolyticum]